MVARMVGLSKFAIPSLQYSLCAAIPDMRNSPLHSCFHFADGFSVLGITCIVLTTTVELVHDLPGRECFFPQMSCRLTPGVKMTENPFCVVLNKPSGVFVWASKIPYLSCALEGHCLSFVRLNDDTSNSVKNSRFFFIEKIICVYQTRIPLISSKPTI